jgi:AbiV family abortive infection protein
MEFADLMRIRKACLTHAEDLITVADKLLAETDVHNIAYHLAVLALEEIGKFKIVFNHHMASDIDENFPTIGKHWDDHEKKIFWAAFDPFWEMAELNPDTVRDTMALAQRIHNLRLDCLYVDPWNASGLSPKLTVTQEETGLLISFARTRLSIAKELEEPKELSESDKTAMRWFFNAIRDPERRNLVLSPKSRAKCKELGSTSKWIDWMKAEFEEAERKSLELTRKMLSGHKRDSSDPEAEKWRIKIRLYSDSHSLRASDLIWWNKGVQWIKLRDVHKKDRELIAEFTFLKSVAPESVWGLGLHCAHRLLLALNISSFGFFWWYLPAHTDRFYEDLYDIEEKARVKLTLSPSLRIDWGKRVLSEHCLKRAALLFSMLPKPEDERGMLIYGHYLQGLAFISKNDIHLRLEVNAFLEFYKALKLGMQYYGDWDGREPFQPSSDFSQTMQESGMTLDRYVSLGAALEMIPPDTGGITLREVGEMKVVCDAYFSKTLSRVADERSQFDRNFVRDGNE